jgi:hypothetical protein
MKIQMTNERFLELSSDIAEAIIVSRIGVLAWEVRGDGSEGFTEEGQDLFNETLDIIQARLLDDIEITNP